MPSPRTVLYISLLIAVLSNPTTATPILTSSLPPHLASTSSSTELAGKIFSWLSTFLYLGSRLPQLYKNQIRRSTAGLSPTLFAAAFFGNLFYSSSLLANPCAWFDYAPGEGRGWVGVDGNAREDWILRAAPFFLGAAGVLIMDAAVGVQFWYFSDVDAPRGRAHDNDDIVITVDEHGRPMRKMLRFRRVSGWMRGWAPAVSVAATPNVSRAATPVDGSRSVSPSGGGSQSIPIRGALEEARALLGMGRHASPRSYGAVGSPR
jgi:hypothetical protein